jgi:ribosomal protein S27E
MDANEYIEVECQQCHKNKVMIKRSGAYLGILCNECSKTHIFTLV